MKMQSYCYLVTLVLSSMLSSPVVAADQALIRMMRIDENNVGNLARERFQSAEERGSNSFNIFNKTITAENELDAENQSEDAAEEEKEGVKLQPGLSAGESNINPSLTFSTTKGFDLGGDTRTLSVTFEFSANSKLDTEEPNEMLKNYLFQGGDLNFNLGLNYVPKSKWLDGFGFQLSYDYALLSGEELTVDSTVNEIDAEIQSLGALLMYQFNEVTLKAAYTDYFDVESGDAENELVKLIDGDESWVIGLLMPLGEKNEEGNYEYLLKFERARSSKIDEGLFRIGIEAQF